MSVVRRKDVSEDLEREARDPLALSLGEVEAAGLTTAFQPERVHQGKHLSVTSELAVGIDQKIFLKWSFPEKYQRKGYRLIGCRTTGGFASTQARPDPDRHGLRIIDSRTAGAKEELLPEGDYFYTFFLQRTILGLLTLTADVVQFSEAIPTAEHVITRLRQNITARELVQDLIRMASSKGTKDRGPRSGADISALLAEQHKEIDELKASAGFASLSANEQKYVIDAVKARYRKRMAEQNE